MRKKPVINTDTNKIYPSVADAERALRMAKGTLYQTVGIPYKKAAGYHWEYANKEDIEANKKKLKQNGIKETKPSHCRKVGITETGEVYNSIKEASEFFYIDPSCIHRAIKHPENRTAAGYHWEYVD